MKPIPVSAAKLISDTYDYDQVVIIAREVSDNITTGGEHVTTYGVNSQNCEVAARIGNFLKYEIMKWSPPPSTTSVEPDNKDNLEFLSLLKAAQYMLESLDKIPYRDSANHRMNDSHPAYESLKQATTQAAVKVALSSLPMTKKDPNL